MKAEVTSNNKERVEYLDLLKYTFEDGDYERERLWQLKRIADSLEWISGCEMFQQVIQDNKERTNAEIVVTPDSLVGKGIIDVRRREDGELVFSLTELGKATMKNDGVVPPVYLKDE